TDKFEHLVEMLPEGTDSTLLVEFYAEDEAAAKQKVADLLADRVPEPDSTVGPSSGAESLTDAPEHAFAAMEAFSSERQTQFWEMRKAGLPILLSNTGDERHWPYIEDTAIPAENLPDYVADFQEILDELDTFAAYYAHAGPGVLHIRPLLNLKTQEGVDKMEEIADRVTDLVMKYDGSVSGEHGDGRARTQWNEKFYGSDLWSSFRSLKRSLDPDWILNPGQVCGEADGPTDMTEHLRFDPSYEFEVPFDPVLEWDNENGFQGMTELCHGCAGCTGYQDTTGGVMCPTYRAAEEEITSTRGRANMLRSAMNGELPDELFTEEFVNEVLDLCISCKGCKMDCPSGVDMAKLKAEVEHEYHQREGKSLRDRVFAHVDRLAGLASTFAPLSTWTMSIPGVEGLLERTIGVATERSLPVFGGSTVQDWFETRGGPAVPEADAEQKVLLFPDTYTNYSRQHVGKAAVRVLEAAGVHVQIADSSDSGRPAFSKSFLDVAKARARENVRSLTPQVREGWDVVCVEPSDAVMMQSDYLDLLEGSDVQLLAENVYGVMEYLNEHDLVESLEVAPGDAVLTYHGHCHQKGTGKDHHTRETLERAGFEVDELDSGCCGMAGTFGYEAEHYSMSRAIGQLVFDQVRESPGEALVAPGASCRTQFEDSPVSTGQPPHPVETLAEALK
ncbi:MAG: FAD-linked oxidase C-terminal domain-containing protein, partial [Halodesulfurarchaeum sp.]